MGDIIEALSIGDIVDDDDSIGVVVCGVAIPWLSALVDVLFAADSEGDRRTRLGGCRHDRFPLASELTERRGPVQPKPPRSRYVCQQIGHVMKVAAGSNLQN